MKVDQNSELIALVSRLASIIEEDRKTITVLSEKVNSLELAVRNLPYEVHDPDFIKTLRYPKIMSAHDTLLAVKNGKSLCRYGDGEFWQMFDPEKSWAFQKSNPALGERLRQVMRSKREDVLICVPDFFGALFMKLDENGQRSTRENITPERRKKYLDFIEEDRLYGDPFAVWPNTPEKASGIRSLWEGKDIILVEGKMTRIGVGNDFLDNASSVKRILCPPKDAFSSYRKILDRALSEDKSALYLIALGPAATVLAYDLADSGRQAVDIGHADVFYEYYLAALRGDSDPNAGNLRFKDASDGGTQLSTVQDTKDEKYLSSIIAEIS